MSKVNSEIICIGLTEQGKLYVLSKDYDLALKHFQEAVRISAKCQNRDLYLYNASICILETLDLQNAYNLICSYCEEADIEFQKMPDDKIVHALRLEIMERNAVAQLQRENLATAHELLNTICELDEFNNHELSKQLKAWVERGLTIQMAQIEHLKKKYGFYKITQKNTRPDLAINTSAL